MDDAVEKGSQKLLGLMNRVWETCKMQDEHKTKEQLIEELKESRGRVRELETSEAECKRMEERVREQTDFLNLILESLPYPFYVIDASDYTIKLANSAAHAGRLSDGITCHSLTHHSGEPCSDEAHPCPLKIVRETKKPVTVEHVHYDKDGNPKNVAVHGYPIFDDDGNVSQMIESSIDITERKQAEEALKKRSEQMKLFAYSVAHDLRNPAVGLYGLTKRLHKQYGDVADEKAKDYCDKILEAAEQISALVGNINVYISSKEMPLNIEDVKLPEVLQIVRDEFSVQLDIRQIRWSESESIPEIKADKLSILRILRNLLDNALKYGGDDLSEIKIGYERSDQFHILSVSDDGVGIKGEDAEKIFEVFERHKTSSGVEGTGMGLAIVKELAEQHGGEVWVEPGLENGTTFYISIASDL
ncbi:MAG: PAS domain S-box protein [Deltaproteobacteria bacterium]|nr:PAS domain S-box protein [Deltaproteobacteria bacterium]